MNIQKKPKTVVLGVLGVDAHVVGNKIMAHALENEEFKVVNIGIFSSQEDFIRALRAGVLPDGKKLSPAMPLKTYGEMNDTELAALWLYLQSSPPLKSQK